ncbi:MAG: fibronectin type III domain-containing protein [Candidatus Riflebacteria bacterium]|nr:fibronectin type III domain-containing protein [Candidatus Riflebacteria bacterium]
MKSKLILAFITVVCFSLIFASGCRVGDGNYAGEIVGYNPITPETPSGNIIEGIISQHLLETVDIENLIDRTDPSFQVPGENVSEEAPIANILKSELPTAKVLKANEKRKLLVLSLNYFAVLRDINGKILDKSDISPTDGTFTFSQFSNATDLVLKTEIMLKKIYFELVSTNTDTASSSQKVSLLTFVEKTAIVQSTGSGTSSLSQINQTRVVIDAESIAIFKIYEAGKIEAEKQGTTFTVEDAKKSPEMVQTVINSINEVLNKSTDNMVISLIKVLEFRGEELSKIASNIILMAKIENITVSSITENSAVISWTTDQNTTSQVEYGPANIYSNSSILDSTLTKNHSVTITGLVASVTYHYRVKARPDFANDKTEVVSGNRVFQTLPSLDKQPPVISEFNIELVGLDTLKVSWNTNEPTLGMVQYGQTVKYGFVTNLKAALTTYQEFEISGFVPGETYHLRALAVDVAGNSANTSDSMFSIPDAELPEISNLKVIPSTSSAQISWVTEKKCKRQIEYGLTKSYGETQNYSATNNSYHTVNLANLLPGKEYFFKITVKDEKEKVGSFEGSFLTLVPGAPNLFDFVNTHPLNGKVNFNWTTDQQARSYIEYGETFDYGKRTEVTATFSTTQLVSVSNLIEGQTYHFRAASTNSAGQTGYTRDFLIQVPDTTKPVISDISAGKTGTDSVSISWKTNEPTIGKIKYGPTSTLDFFSFYSTDFSLENQAVIKNLEAGKQYYFRVVAKDRAENEAESETGSFSTQLELKNFPPEVKIIGSSTEIQDLWFQSVYEGNSLVLKAVATDPNPGDTVSFLWSSTKGQFSSTISSETAWTAPFGIESAECFCKVTDSKGLSSTASVKIRVIPLLKTGKGRIFGTLIDLVTGLPISGAVVGLNGTNYRTISLSDGAFEINDIDPGNYTVVIMRGSYEYKSIPNVVITND